MKAKVRTVARSVKKHRVFFLFVMGLFTVGLLAGSYAIQSNAGFPGQTRAGDHEFWGSPKGDNGFCANCHTDVGTDITDGPHRGDPAQSMCSTCHTPGNANHAAAAAACTDCHSSEAGDLESGTEAHNTIMADLGESPTDASTTCQACHTHAEVTMTLTTSPPIPLKMAP